MKTNHFFKRLIITMSMILLAPTSLWATQYMCYNMDPNLVSFVTEINGQSLVLHDGGVKYFGGYSGASSQTKVFSVNIFGKAGRAVFQDSLFSQGSGQMVIHTPEQNLYYNCGDATHPPYDPRSVCSQHNSTPCHKEWDSQYTYAWVCGGVICGRGSGGYEGN